MPVAEVDKCLGKWELSKLYEQHGVQILEDPKDMEGGSWFNSNKKASGAN